MFFLEYVNWLEIKDGEFGDYGWISVSELEAYDPEGLLQDNYITMREYVNPAGSIFLFLVKKSCKLLK